MKKLFVTALAMVFVISSCTKAEKKETETSTAQQTQQTKEPEKQMDSNKLQKWPADYPIGGDSVAVMDIEQDGVGNLGTIVIEFYPDKAPNHVRNFKWLADHKFYDGVTFHRVIKGFMIQGGDPDGNGMGGPGWTVDAEFNDIPHEKGILSMARTNDPNSAGSQFFIVHESAPHLNGQYTVFGKVIKGLDIVDKIATTEVRGSTPVHTVKMKSVRIVARSEAKL